MTLPFCKKTGQEALAMGSQRSTPLLYVALATSKAFRFVEKQKNNQANNLHKKAVKAPLK